MAWPVTSASAGTGNACFSCDFYYTSLDPASTFYCPQCTWPPNTASYCGAIQCGPIENWDQLDLFAIPVVLSFIIACLTKNIQEMWLAQLLLHQWNDVGKYSHISFSSAALLLGLKASVYLQAYVVTPATLYVSVQLILTSSNALAMVGNAVAIVFLMDFDNMVLGIMLTNRSAQRMLGNKLSISMTRAESRALTKRRNIVFALNLVWSTGFVCFSVLWTCGSWSYDWITSTLVLLSFYGFVVPDVAAPFHNHREKTVVASRAHVDVKRAWSHGLPVSCSFVYRWLPALWPIFAIKLPGMLAAHIRRYVHLNTHLNTSHHTTPSMPILTRHTTPFLPPSLTH